MNKFTLSLVTTAFSISLFAQEPKGCITHKVMEDYFKQNPEAKKRIDAQDVILAKLDAEAAKTGYKNGYRQVEAEKASNPDQTQATIYYIPIVFHILHTGGPENIVDAQVRNAVSILNRDWRKQNPDTSVTIPAFKGIASDVQIEFRLATTDPNGNCTNGIVRHNDPHTVWTSQNWSWYAYTWDPTKYLNVYVVKSINGTAAGYTYLPGTFGSGNPADVIVILSTYIGAIGTGNPSTSRALTHECGHWLNLRHPWGNTNNPGVACGDDLVSDTPITEGSNLVCNTSLAYCNPPTVENVQNYMDYSYCSTMFTAGQVARMRNTVISNTGNVGRSNVISSSNLLATGVTNPQVCVPVADFHSTTRVVCVNTTVTFSDSSYNAHPTSWNWSCPGGTFVNGTSATDSMPQVSYATPGTYAVSYSATTSAGTGTISKTSYMTALTSTPTYNTAWVEGFETSAVPGSDWSVYHSPGVIDWSVTSSAAALGSKSVYIDNFGSNSPGNISVLQSTSFNLDTTIFHAPVLTFQMAYQQQSTSNNDKLQFFSSINCGQTWQSRWSRNGTPLSTVPGTGTNPFIPTPSQFATYTVNVNGLSGNTDVRFKFVFSADPNGQGNNIYLDNINLFDGAAGVAQLDENISLNIYPNPSSGNVHIDFNLSNRSMIGVTVTDVIGRVVENIPAKQYGIGNSSLTIGDKMNYGAGVYFINISADGKKISRKIIIR